MTPRHERSDARPGRRTTILAAITLTVLATLLAATGSASAQIYDPDAEPCWQFFIAGTGGGNDNATDVAMTSTATWVAGQVDNGATNLDASLVRIPAGSSVQPVVRSWNSPASSNDANYAVAARGSYVYTAGATRNSSNNLDLILVRWSSLTGAFKWARRYAGAAKMDDEATDVVIDGNGNAIVCGTTENLLGRTSWVVRKYSPAGDKKWTWTYDGSALTNDTPTEMVVDSKNNIYVTGHTQQDAVMGFFTVKLSPTGAKLWSRKYRGFDGLGGWCWAIARCPSGGVYVGGMITSETTSYDMVVLRYGATGTRTVFEYFTAGNDPTWEGAKDIAVASNGNVYAAGAKDESDPVWAAWLPYGGLHSGGVVSTPGYDSWEAVATDRYGGVYIAGPYDNVSVNPNIRTFRFSALPGGASWTYDYDVNGYDRSFGAMAVSGLSVATVGRQYNGTDYDQYVHIWTY